MDENKTSSERVRFHVDEFVNVGMVRIAATVHPLGNWNLVREEDARYTVYTTIGLFLYYHILYILSRICFIGCTGYSPEPIGGRALGNGCRAES